MIDITDVLYQLFANLWWIIPILILIRILKWVTYSGKIGELRVNRVIKKQFPSSKYTLFYNITLNTSDGTTQIDHVVVSCYGVFLHRDKRNERMDFR